MALKAIINERTKLNYANRRMAIVLAEDNGLQFRGKKY